MWDGHQGRVSVAEHRVGLPSADAKPICSAPYRAGPKECEFERTEIEKMLSEGFFDPTQTEWAAPKKVVAKKDGSLRFCVNYWNLSAVTNRES